MYWSTQIRQSYYVIADPPFQSLERKTNLHDWMKLTEGVVCLYTTGRKASIHSMDLKPSQTLYYIKMMCQKKYEAK